MDKKFLVYLESEDFTGILLLQWHYAYPFGVSAICAERDILETSAQEYKILTQSEGLILLGQGMDRVVAPLGYLYE